MAIAVLCRFPRVSSEDRGEFSVAIRLLSLRLRSTDRDFAFRGVAKLLPDDPTISGPTQRGEVKDFLVLDDTAAAKKLFGEVPSDAMISLARERRLRSV